MNRPSDQFFAGPGLAQNEHTGISWRNNRYLFEHGLQAAACADDLAEVVLAPNFFLKDAPRIIDRMREERGAQLVRDWLKNRCEELDKAGKIKPRADKITEFDDKGNPMPTVYRPCMSLR
jgi:hypothetical protein